MELPMRAALVVLGMLVVAMSSGLLGSGAGAANGMGGLLGGGPKTNALKPNAMKMEAPSKNPLDAVMDDIYRREMNGEITPDQAMDIYGAAVEKATPQQLQEHHRNMDKRMKEGQ